MATESVAKYILEADDATRIQWLLTSAIMAKTELDQFRNNVAEAAKSNMTAADLAKGCLMPRAADLDIYEAASMVQVLSVLPVAEEA